MIWNNYSGSSRKIKLTTKLKKEDFMKDKETLENCLVAIAVIISVVMIKISMGYNVQKTDFGKSGTDSVHALVVDSIGKL